MPSPTAGLFGGLATGIFGRMREHEDEQRQTDLDERKNALNSLSSLLEHATPDTRPVIYKQMADVMKLKGKHRGVWDMLTGQGRDDYHQQLSSQLDNVFGNVVGPEKYQQLQQEGVKQDLGAAFQANSPYVRSTAPKPTEGKVALRDPIAEHLNALKSQYGLQNDRRSAEIELRNKLAGERELANDIRDAASQKDIAEQRAALKAFGPIMQRAQELSGNISPTREAIEQAAQEHATKFGLNIDKLKAQIEFLTTGSQRNLAIAQSAGSADKPITPFQQQGIDEKQQQRGIETYNKFNTVLGTINKIGTQQTNLRNQLSGINPLTGAPDPSKSFKFDEQAGSFSGPNGPVKFVNPRVQKMIDDLRKSEEEKVKLKTELDTHRNVLKNYHDQQFDIKDDWTVSPNANYGAVAPAGAPRTGNPPPFPASAASPLAGIKEYRVPAKTSSGEKIPLNKPGDIIDTGNGKIRIKKVLGTTSDGTVRYEIERIQ